MLSWCARQWQAGQLAEEPGFGLHDKSQDFWAVTYRKATRCCCRASKGPDSQVREVRASTSAPHPSLWAFLLTDLLWGPGFALRNDSSWSRHFWCFCSGVQQNILIYTPRSGVTDEKDPEARWKLTVYPNPLLTAAKVCSSPAYLLSNSNHCLEFSHVLTLNSVIRRKNL